MYTVLELGSVSLLCLYKQHTEVLKCSLNLCLIHLHCLRIDGCSLVIQSACGYVSTAAY